MKPGKILDSEYAQFRSDIIEYFCKKILIKNSIILDPLAGTAPLIPFIETHGHIAYFNDILPVHFYINNAKTYKIFIGYKKRGYNWFLKELLFCMKFLKDKRLCISEKWIEDSILEGLIRAWNSTEKYEKNISTLFKAVIVCSVRSFSSTTKSKNPTWPKIGGMSSNKTLKDIVGYCLNRFDNYYMYYESTEIAKKGNCFFYIKSASTLNLNQKVDLIITSPPYCNRLDNVRLYGPENYFLSAVGDSILQNGVIATTKVKDYQKFDTDFNFITNSSDYAKYLLNKIKNSPIENDPKYYLKYYTRYFTSLVKLFVNVLNILSSNGKMYVVLQDNIHRDELIETDKVLKEYLKTKGWQTRTVKKWERHHLGLRNVSRSHAFIKKKQFEKLIRIWQ